MDSSRRNLMKLAGLSVVGLSAAPVLNAVASGGGSDTEAQPRLLPNREALTAKRWAMVVDLEKCLRDRGCTKCAEVCHKEHNVPNLADSRFNLNPEEVKKREIQSTGGAASDGAEGAASEGAESSENASGG